MRDAENIRAVESLGVSWMGFIFAKKSSRYVAERPAYMPVKAKRVGVFVDETPEVIGQKAALFGLDIIQLHGHETPEVTKELRKSLTGVKIVKVFNVATAQDLKPTALYEHLADYFLFDTKAEQPGGNGTKFDWSVLNNYRGATPFLLSGGIGPDDTLRLRQFQHDKMVGIDLNSRFETAPAMKDINLLKRFINEQDQ